MNGSEYDVRIQEDGVKLKEGYPGSKRNRGRRAKVTPCQGQRDFKMLSRSGQNYRMDDIENSEAEGKTEGRKPLL